MSDFGAWGNATDGGGDDQGVPAGGPNWEQPGDQTGGLADTSPGGGAYEVGDFAPGGNEILASGPPRPVGKRRIWLAAACAVVLVAGGTTVSLELASESSAGAASPAAAVQNFFTAVQDSDVIGVMDALDPGERTAVEPGVNAIFSQLERLNVVSTDASLDQVIGISVKFSSINTTTRQLSDSVAAVTVAPTTLTGTVDPAKLQLGSFITDVEQQLGTGPGGPSTSTQPSGPMVIGTVEVSGSWYVSLGYTAAINILDSQGQDPTPPPASQALQPAGASSPQGAVQAFFQSISDMDLSELVADLPPDELAPLYAYAPDWLPQAQAEINKLKGTVQISFTNLDLSTEQLDSGTLVKIGPGLSFTASGKGNSVTYAHGCYTVTEAGKTQSDCTGSADSQDQAGLKSVLAALPSSVRAIVERLQHSQADFGFVTVEENGLWYLSPVRTILQSIVAPLELLQPSDLVTVLDNRQGIEAAFSKLLSSGLNGALGGAAGSAQTAIPLTSGPVSPGWIVKGSLVPSTTGKQ